MHFLALDTSQINNIVSDLFCKNSKTRESIKSQLYEIYKTTAIPYFTWYHLEEMLSHKNDDLIKKRLSVIQSLPVVGWLKKFDSSPGVGAITDLHAFELSIIKKTGELETSQIKNRCANNVFQIGSGEDLIKPYIYFIDEIREELWKKENRAREIVAISRSGAINPIQGTIKELLNERRLHSSEVALYIINIMSDQLSQEIRKRGDKRIDKPDDVARKFYSDILELRSKLKSINAKELILELFAKFNINLMSFPEETKISQIFEILETKNKINLVLEMHQITLNSKILSEIQPTTLPSMAITYSLRKYGQDQPERKGSELNDRYLASIAPYVDVLYVDKRTANDFIQMKRKVPEICALTNRVKKSCHISEILEDARSFQ